MKTGSLLCRQRDTLLRLRSGRDGDGTVSAIQLDRDTIGAGRRPIAADLLGSQRQDSLRLENPDSHTFRVRH